MKKPKAIHLRRLSQIIFLVIFLILFLQAKDPLHKTIPPDLLLRIDPFAALVTMISGRTIITTFWPALIVLLLAFVLGRSFCGWICPLGTTMDGWNHIVPAGKRKGNRRWKYTILFGILLLATLSVQILWLFDPLVIFTRSLTVSIYPLSVWAVDAIINAGISVPLTEGLAFWFWDLLQGWFLTLNPLHTALLSTTAIIFFGILLLDSIFGRRLWCRVLCPLGALLGLIGHVSPFGRKVDPECTECALCETDCRMGAIEDNFVNTKRSECILCLECNEVCAVESTTYTWHKQDGGQESFNFGRRRVLGVMGASVLFGGIMHAQLRSRADDAYLIRPPGAVEEDKFLDLCLRCEDCVKACSSTGACLQPAGAAYGWSGFWTPQANMRAGYCEYSCILCGEVCPSGAIKPLTEEAKQKKVIGLAKINTSTCIPFATGVDCIVCEEHCPTPKKAILFRLGEVTLLDGIKEGVKLPYVDASICIGCGICETKCPVVGESAIRIANEGQQRET